jgi:tetratricopeptide (TPR) repeat protein
MKRLITIAVILFLMIPIGLRAQLDPVSLALRAYQAGDLPKAQELIEIAVDDDNFNKITKTWYFRGYIYKDLYKQAKEGQSKQQSFEYRDASVESFRTTIELEPQGELVEDCYNSLKYLSSTIYNDAAFALDTNNFEAAQRLYDQYQDITAVTNPEMDITQRTIEFKLYKANKYSSLFDGATTDDDKEKYSQKVTEVYKEVLVLDSNNISANYNLAIHYYNQGVNIIENMDYDTDFETLFAIQAQVMELFGQALPYMKKAYKLNPKRKETLVGLSGIYFGLNDIEKSEYYQDELKKLQESEGNQ